MRQTLYAVGLAIVSCQQIGTVHACYVLALSRYLVQSSRSNFYINANVRKEVTALPIILDAEVLCDMDGSESAISNSPASQLGKRDAYHALVLASLSKFKKCEFDFYSFASSYRTTKESAVPRGAGSRIKEFNDIPLTVDDDTGLINNAYSFTIGLKNRSVHVMHCYYCTDVGEKLVKLVYLVIVRPRVKDTYKYKRVTSEILLADTGTPHADVVGEDAVELFDHYVSHRTEDDNYCAPNFLAGLSEDDVEAAVPLSTELGQQLVMFLSGEGDFKRPFGGLHTILAGDFYQMKPVSGTPLCGLYNGTMGTVWGFVYQGKGPQTAKERVPSDFGILEDDERELPIVLVQIDGDDESFPYSCSREVPRLVPIVPIADTQRIEVCKSKYTRYMLPITPAHARTGHSIQGMTSYYGVVVEMGSMMFYA
eukprot:gene29120-36112_t